MGTVLWVMQDLYHQPYVRRHRGPLVELSARMAFPVSYLMQKDLGFIGFGIILSPDSGSVTQAWKTFRVRRYG